MDVSKCSLQSRFGDFSASSPPTDAELSAVASEVLDEATVRARVPMLVEGDFEEHPNAWLELSRENGTLLVLDLYRTGRLDFSEYSDGDMSQLVSSGSLERVAVSQAVVLWRSLRDGRVEEVLRAFPAISSGAIAGERV